ncbi:MAG: hypothetical protein K9L86_00145 [Candidatus Omnitrophica bacterium]|nr:hypothetical protein [Candidatus Omnitrophota bacterium]
MYKKNKKLTKAQIALEYIAACLVFAGVGIASFFAINHAAVMTTRGGEGSLSDNTLLGKTLNDGVPDTAPPEDWSQPQEGLGGALPEDTADPEAVTENEWGSGNEGDFLGGSNDPLVSNFGEEGDNLLAGSGAGDHWINNEPEDLDLPDADEVNTAEELQGGFNSATDQFFSQNEAGYTDEGMDQINQNLNDDWFMGSVEETPGAEE